MKRLLDIFVSLAGLVVFSPILATFMFAIWVQDRRSPFFIANRVGIGGQLFRMVKLRSMVVGAAKTGVDSTGNDDVRITAVGRLIRKYKIDEVMQLWNVLLGDMSLVGPRPNVKAETDIYTKEERVLLSVKPGITDFSSIVFSDEGNILEGQEDPDLAYNQLIRPGKSRLGLFYISKASIALDIRLIWLTAVALVSRRSALVSLCKLMRNLDAKSDLVELASREKPLMASAPPGAQEIVTSRIS